MTNINRNLKQQLQEMLLTNDRQRSFYETPPEQRGNLASQIWRKSRNKVKQLRSDLQISSLIYQRHLDWMGDLRGKRVLDLGCYAGNHLSFQIASQCEFYLGIDLSEPAIEQLRQKLKEQNLFNARAEAIDFLGADFPYEPFDIIYAYGVMHHFKHFDVFLKVLQQRLAPNGRVITFDPMETSLPVWIARRLYRPFQSDKDWEWPFSRETFQHIEQHFDIADIQGVLGYSKWAIPLAAIPFGNKLSTQIAQRLHDLDVREATKPGSGLWRCMQVAMHLQRKDP
jgi:2-polyprenyl-3-methyl-5-hydroxy-6-metoxy-1,4-benzoquinol methylase